MGRIFASFPELAVIVNGVANYLVRYLNYDNSILYNLVVSDGGDAINPVETGAISTPAKPATEDIQYTFLSFGTLPTNIHANTSVTAQYAENYAVRFYGDESALLHTEFVRSGQNATEPIGAGIIETPEKETTPQYTYAYSGWDTSLENITEPRSVNAVFEATLRSYTVRFMNGTELIFSQIVDYGGNAIYFGDNPTKESTVQYHYTFSGWTRTEGGEADENALINITGDTNIYAAYNDRRRKNHIPQLLR